jgi:hypothetical protein
MGMTADRKFDWIAALSVAAGAAVIVPSIAGVAVSLMAVAVRMF